MAIHRVVTNVLEDYQAIVSSYTPFTPAIIARFPTGPVNEWVKVSSPTDLEVFGTIDNSLPTANHLKEYANLYRDMYVYRVSSADASQGESTLTFDNEGEEIELLSIKTTYKTEQYNGAVVKILKEESYPQIYLKVLFPDKTFRTIGVDIDITTADAVELSEALDTLVKYANMSQSRLVFENKFVDRISGDPIPNDYTALSSVIEGGNSGNASTIEDKTVIAATQYLDSIKNIIDAILAPEFKTVPVMTALSTNADKSDYVYLTSMQLPEVIDELPLATAQRYIDASNMLPECKSRIMYYPSIYKNNISDTGVISGMVEIPAELAMLKTYAINDDIGKWIAPEGISDANKRGLLTDAIGLKYIVTDDVAEALYNAKNPINYFRDISGIGIIALGNKTQYPSEVFSKIHVVRMSKYLHREFQDIGYHHIGDPIDEILYDDYRAKLIKLLDNIKANRGIEEYVLKIDNENNTEKMKQDGIIYANVRIKYYNIVREVQTDLVFTNILSSADVEGGTGNGAI